ncbi:hypothetical protein Poli38472_001422 [Pythium oligandrum]|uniref:Serine hydrolase domain-containing protein n=1 Tax=Pythium oligandrum TaxID=41045 RepID=A0A8K1CVA0_PYTOL|nr:hypothetical protein Poli38472_001422 [Pythium oligandrum]|eukprot:TMW69266.1 hypothetical protein Poli38472_001422 [Pythium oligandrum]
MAPATTSAALARRNARKLRVLCLHGMYQNGDVFATKTEHLRRGHDDLVDFIYVDAPFTVVPRILTQRQPRQPKKEQSPQPTGDHPEKQHRVRCTKKHDEFRAWWRPPSGSHHVSNTQLDDDRKVLMAFLHETLAEVGDVDGVMGFSQGATLASWMCSAQARVELQWSPRLAILIGSYLGPTQYDLTSGILDDVTSLHMFGSNDHVISAAKSQKVVDLFKSGQVHDQQVLTSIHNQGHVIPKSDEVLSLFQTFLHQQHHTLAASPSTHAESSW